MIARARALLAELEAAGQRTAEADEARQLGLFAPPRDPFLDELAALDLAHLTPIEALNLLAKWQGQVSAIGAGEASPTVPIMKIGGARRPPDSPRVTRRPDEAPPTGRGDSL